MWDILGFRKSPYDVNPLTPCAEDVDLLVGREKEKIDFITAVESSPNGVMVLSGIPGVGKTSFFNVVQYLLESQKAGFGPKLLAARQLCPIKSDDNPREIALRALISAVSNVSSYCQTNGVSLPAQISKLSTWLAGKHTSGFDFGIQILGCGGNFGRESTLPQLSEATFEALKDAIECCTSEAINKLNIKGAFIVLDNLENLDEDKMSSVLMAFRDTLFTIPNLWWILIGQSGLSSLLSTLDRRVSERLNGPGLELNPLSTEQVHEAIALRVKRFHNLANGKSPLTSEMHKRLYDVSQGEIRFIFKYSNSICIKFVSFARQKLEEDNAGLEEKTINEVIGEYMIEEQLNYEYSLSLLKEIIKLDIEGLKLRPKDKAVLKKIGQQHGTRAKDYSEYGLKSGQDFSSNYLSRYYASNLLLRQQEGRSVKYLLRGIALLANEFGYLD